MKKIALIVIFILFACWFFLEGVTHKKVNSYKLNKSDSLGSINCYFNKYVDLSFASSKNNYANGNVNLENVLISRIKQSKYSIDAALYELNLPNIVDALIDKASQGVTVRVIFDAKNPKDEHYIARYKLFRTYVEKLLRGKDKKIGTADDINIFADGVMFAVKDSELRKSILGDKCSINDIEYREVIVGKRVLNDRVLCLGEFNNKRDKFYSGNEQMHNKYLIVDNRVVWTGSWNLTLTGLYGNSENMKLGKLNGNIQHSIEIIDTSIANRFTNNFNVMWGSSSANPDYYNAKFHSRKKYPPSTHIVGGDLVELFFPAGEAFLDRVDEIIKTECEKSVYFNIFAWSYQPIVNSLKDKCDKKGGIELKGVFDDSYWNQWWSASFDMRGVIGRESENNPSVPWNSKPDIYKDGLAVKMHAKTMIIDSDSDSDPTVITGSANWSINSVKKNDENVVIIHSKDITNQFVQSFFASYNLAKRLE